MSVVFANILDREIDGKNDTVITSAFLDAKAIFPLHTVDYVKEDKDNPQNSILCWNPYSMNHALNSESGTNKVLFILSDDLDGIYDRSSKVSIPVIDVIADWMNGDEIVPTRFIIPLSKIEYIANKPLDGLDYIDTMETKNRGISCNDSDVWILWNHEGMGRTLILIQDDMDVIASQLCDGEFLSDCNFPS